MVYSRMNSFDPFIYIIYLWRYDDTPACRNILMELIQIGRYQTEVKKGDLFTGLNLYAPHHG